MIDTAQGETYLDIVWKQFRKNRIALAMVWVVLGLFGLAIFAPVIASNQPYWFRDAEGLRFPWLVTAAYGLYIVDPVTARFEGLGPANRTFIVKYSHQFDVLQNEIRERQTTTEDLRNEIETKSAAVLRFEDEIAQLRGICRRQFDRSDQPHQQNGSSQAERCRCDTHAGP